MARGVARPSWTESQRPTPAGPQGRRGSSVVLVLGAITILGMLLVATVILAGADPGLAVVGAAYPLAADLAGRLARRLRPSG